MATTLNCAHNFANEKERIRMFGHVRYASICKLRKKDTLRERRCKHERYEALNVVQKCEEDKLKMEKYLREKKE